MPRVLPVDTIPDRIFTVTLSDTVSVRVRCVWRPRTGSWYADLLRSDGTAVVRGVRISPNYWLFAPHVLPEGMQGGRFYVRGPDEYREDDLGGPLKVIWYPADEIPAATDLGLVVT